MKAYCTASKDINIIAIIINIVIIKFKIHLPYFVKQKNILS